MGIIIDIIIVGIIALFTFLGYKKGLVDVAYKLVALLAALILTFILFKPVSNYIINNTELDENIEKIIIENTQTKEEDKTTKEEKNETTLIKYIEKYITDTTEETKDATIQAVSRELSISIVNAIVMIALFIILRIALIALKLASDLIASLPIIKQFNELGGTIYGLAKGIIIIYILLAIIFLISSMKGGTTLQTYIDSSIIGKMMYANNILLRVI